MSHETELNSAFVLRAIRGNQNGHWAPHPRRL